MLPLTLYEIENKEIIYYIIIIIIYLFYILHLSAKRYEELLAIRLGKPFMDKNPRHPSFAPFLCSPLLIYGCRY
jgi:hypothetical protein